MLVTIKRIAVIEDGCFSAILLDGVPLCVSVERTFPDGGRQRVVIPTGKTTASATTYIRGGYPTFEIAVPGHSRVLFHKGNMENDSEGCVVLGSSFGVLGGKPAVLGSAAAMTLFMSKVGSLKSFDVEVSNP